MAAFYSLLCKAIKKQPAGRSGRLFWRSGRDSNPRAIARKLISSYLEAKEPEFRRRILSSPRFRNHSHMLTPTHQPKRSQLRRYSVEKQSPFS